MLRENLKFDSIDRVSIELVEDAACGVYVEPENPKDFAEKILAYETKSKTEKETEGESGYIFAKKEFDRDVLADKYLKYLKQIAGKR